MILPIAIIVSSFVIHTAAIDSAQGVRDHSLSTIAANSAQQQRGATAARHCAALQA